MARIVKGLPHIGGFAKNHARPGEIVEVLAAGVVFSDQLEFYTYAGQLTSMYLSRSAPPILPSFVASVLVVHHPDGQASIYVDDFRIVMAVRPKSKVSKGDLVGTDQLADITSVHIEGVSIKAEDRVLLILKIGWRFAFIWDCRQDGVGNLELVNDWLLLATRRLFHEDLLDTGFTRDAISQLTQHGWFPFIALLPKDYRELMSVFEAGHLESEADISEYLARFDRERVERMVENWWNVPSFTARKPIIEAGIEAFNAGTPSGTIQSISVLANQVEGVLRASLEDLGARFDRFAELLAHIENRDVEKLGIHSLLLPTEFVNYIRTVLFANFDLRKLEIPPSRHTIDHGILEPQSYHRSLAAQLLLTLDHLHFMFLDIQL